MKEQTGGSLEYVRGWKNGLMEALEVLGDERIYW
jgi:hypothetical protein